MSVASASPPSCFLFFEEKERKKREEAIDIINTECSRVFSFFSISESEQRIVSGFTGLLSLAKALKQGRKRRRMSDRIKTSKTSIMMTRYT